MAQHTLTERQRHQYLGLLGIDSYVPRCILPGAGASVLLDEAQLGASDPQIIAGANTSERRPVSREHTDTYVDTHTASVGDRSVDERSPVLDALINDARVNVPVDNSVPDGNGASVEKLASSADPLSAGADESRSVAEVSQQAQDKPLQFVLNVWRIRDELLVLDSRQPGAAYPTDRLLQNILRAIGYPLAQLPASDLIRWPLFVSAKNTQAIRQQNQDAAQARAMVHAYINAQQSQFPLKALLLMGSAAQRFGLDGAEGDGGDGREPGVSPWSIETVKLPSLFELLQEPLLKAEAWSALQVLCRNTE